ncbi:MAG: DUF308 domain-containing protein [Clostridia bacterium]|nr:DUF308 domain-containing protein [Clostridia bacterium]
MRNNDVKDNVKSLFRSGKTWVLITALAGIALGLIMILNPHGFGTVVCYVMGGLLVLFGVASMVQVFRAEAKSLQFGGMIPGVLALALGLAFFFQRDTMMSILWFLVGVILLIDAVYKLEHAFTMRTASITFWWISMLDAILTLVMAVVVMIRPLDAENGMIILGGAMVLVNGLFDLSEFILLTVAGKQLKTLSVVTIEDAQITDASNTTDVTGPME